MKIHFSLFWQYGLLLLFIASTSPLLAQGSKCPCEKELSDVAQRIKAAKSYKHQIKGKKVDAMYNWQISIAAEMAEDDQLEFYCLGYLQKYISFVKDSHNSISFLKDRRPTQFPEYVVDSTALEALRLQPEAALEGIYHLGSDQIALVQVDANNWYGVMLVSKAEMWKSGLVRLRIKKDAGGQLELFEFQRNGNLLYHKNITVKQGRIYPTFWNKANTYHFHKQHPSTFNYERLDKSTDYISIKSLDRTRALMKEGAAFYEATLPQLTQPYLIVDFRSNTGGAVLQAKALVKGLRRNKSLKKIYVIINCFTGSAAELTVLQLRKNSKVIVVGENSRGMLAYGYGNGSVYNESQCLGYKTSFTVKKSGRNLLRYERVGITPDIALARSTDWLEQIKALIKQDQK